MGHPSEREQELRDLRAVTPSRITGAAGLNVVVGALAALGCSVGAVTTASGGPPRFLFPAPYQATELTVIVVGFALLAVAGVVQSALGGVVLYRGAESIDGVRQSVTAGFLASMATALVGVMWLWWASSSIGGVILFCLVPALAVVRNLQAWNAVRAHYLDADAAPDDADRPASVTRDFEAEGRTMILGIWMILAIVVVTIAVQILRRGTGALRDELEESVRWPLFLAAILSVAWYRTRVERAARKPHVASGRRKTEQPMPVAAMVGGAAVILGGIGLYGAIKDGLVGEAPFEVTFLGTMVVLGLFGLWYGQRPRSE